MFEIDNSIIDPNILLDRVRKNILKISPELRDKYSNQEKSSIIGTEVDGLRIQKELNSLRDNLRALDSTWYIKDEQIKSHRRILGPFIVFAKRAIRKSTYWFVRPYIEKQISFNGATTRAISDTMKIQEMILETLKQK